MREPSRIRWWALLLVLGFVATMTGAAAWKWAHFGYGGLDLAIYTQTLDETVHGRPFQLTIHPHSYLGDHFELILLLLVPVYALFQSPLTLAVVQALALAAGTIPVWRLARRRFRPAWAPLVAVAAYLGHPFVTNAGLFEFHALSFAIPTLLWTLLAFESRRWWSFLLVLLTTLLVREDLSFAAIGFGLLAIVERRPARWIAVPLTLGAAWFTLSMHLTGYFNGEASYKFLTYYAWLGPDLRSIVLNALSQPWVVLGRLLGVSRLVGLLGILLPFAYLPLLAPRVLIAALPFFVQLLLIGVGENALRIHYMAPLLPFLFVASLDGIARLTRATSGRILPRLRREWRLLAVGVGTVAVAAAVVLGPWGQIALEAVRGELTPRAGEAAARAFLRTVERPTRVVATFSPIPYLAAGPSVYSAHYVFLGHRQYSRLPYPVGDEVALVLLDDRDLLTYNLLYADDATEGPRRLQRLLDERGFRLERQVGHLRAYGNRGVPLATPDLAPASLAVDGAITLTGSSGPALRSVTVGGETFLAAEFALRFRTDAPLGQNLQLRATFQDDHGSIQRELFPLNALAPTGAWEPGRDYTERYQAILDRVPQGRLEATIEVVRLEGAVGLNGLRNIVPRYDHLEVVGDPIHLGS